MPLLSAVPLTLFLASGIFVFYIVLLKYILVPIKVDKDDLNIEAINLGQHGKLYRGGLGYWHWFARMIRGTLFNSLAPLIITMIFLIVFLASFYEPSILQHSLFYDIFFMRTSNDTLAAAHWTSYALVTGFFFFAVIYWSGWNNFLDWLAQKNQSMIVPEAIFKAALFSAFLVFFHESLWFSFYYLKSYQTQFSSMTDVLIGDLTFLIMIFTFFLATRMRYKEELTRRFGYGAIIYTAYLAAWFFFDDMRVTTVPFIKDSIPTATATIFYHNPLTNVFEVLSWMLVFGIFVLSVILNNKKHQKIF